MRLEQLIKVLDYCKPPSGIYDFQVKGIDCNSNNILEGFVFVAIKGNNEDGHKFINEAICRGAKAVIFQSPLQKLNHSAGRVNFIRVKDTRGALAKLASQFYGNPSKQIKTVGITGTNGKTTVSYLIEAILKEAGKNPAVIGTVNYRFKNKIIPSKNTTPGALELQSIFSQIRKEGLDYAIMEVSSHALSQDRTEGISFHSAIFTNLTQDHLDYHKTLQNYFKAKSKLFKNIRLRAFAVINNDDAYGRKLKRLTGARVVTYGIENKSDISAQDIKLDISHTEFLLVSPREKVKFRTKLIGRHNIYNILAATSWALGNGLDFSTIKPAIENLHHVPGRLEEINTKRGFVVFVDYAHTEDALMKVIKSLRQITAGRIIVMFGCGGERDKTKRPKMGRVASELADYAIITSDNPRSEDPQDIIDDIISGIKRNNFFVVPERKEAIRKSLSLAKSGDIVLLAGKGHENYQIFRDKTIHFDDREVARECLGQRNY